MYPIQPNSPPVEQTKTPRAAKTLFRDESPLARIDAVYNRAREKNEKAPTLSFQANAISSTSSQALEEPSTPPQEKICSPFSTPPPLTRKRCLFPDTPMKPGKRPKVTSLYQKAAAQAESLKIPIADDKFFFLSWLDQGSFMDVYKIENPEVFKQNVPLVLKTYTEKRARKPSTLPEFMETAQKNYDAAKDKLPVAIIFNNPENDGYVIQEYIPHPINLNDQNQIEQIRAFFLTALKNNLLVDLLPVNLRVDNEGKVKLIDNVEENDDKLQTNINHAIVQFALKYRALGKTREEVKAFLLHLTAEFSKYGYDPENVQEALNDAFPVFNIRA